jgi:hypothetical protein
MIIIKPNILTGTRTQGFFGFVALFPIISLPKQTISALSAFSYRV